MKIITRTVWILSLVSLFADVASEMLYPIIPVYLKEIGFSVFLIGILEGVAECIAGLSKGYFGKWSDESGRRLPFIRGGYALSAISKPMLALFTLPVWVFLARTLDRLGKGLRTAARDALLSAEAQPGTKARVFGFHRGMDTLGAFLGPLLALAFLHFFPGNYPAVFLLAFIPGMISVLLIYLLKETKKPVSTLKRGNFFTFFKYWNIADPRYRKLVGGLLLFALFNSSDVFLLLKTKELTGSDTLTILAYIFYNLVYALFSFPMGVLADRFGKSLVFISGLFFFGLVYAGFTVQLPAPAIFALFFFYGLYAAATEGVAKAWITTLAHHQNTATAVGLYTSLQSIGALLASSGAGLLWKQFGSGVTFGLSSACAFLVAIYFMRYRKSM